MDFYWGYVMGQKSATQAAMYARSAGAAQGAHSTRRYNDLDERIDRLLLVVESMWALLKEHGYSDEELAAKLVELDETDGTSDGKRTLLPGSCRQCGSKVAAGLDACQFCGEALPEDQAPGPFSNL